MRRLMETRALTAQRLPHTLRAHHIAHVEGQCSHEQICSVFARTNMLGVRTNKIFAGHGPRLEISFLSFFLSAAQPWHCFFQAEEMEATHAGDIA